MDDRAKIQRFEKIVTPHLATAYNLAHWLTRNDQDAEDLTQDACVRAYRFLDGFRGHDGRVWLLRIVRNTCYSWLKQKHTHDATLTIDALMDLPSVIGNPETIVLQQLDNDRLAKSMEELPIEFREALVLREIEGMSYKQIAEVAQIPVGTVMSRLARARGRIMQQMVESDPLSQTDTEVRVKESRYGL